MEEDEWNELEGLVEVLRRRMALRTEQQVESAFDG